MTEPLPDYVIPALSRGTVDRAAHRRSDDAWLAAAWADGATRVLSVDGTSLLVDDAGATPRLALRAPAEVDLDPDAQRYFLGVDRLDGGVAYFAVHAPLAEAGPLRPASLREVGAVLDDRDAGLAAHAVGLDNWHATHRRCPRCGAPTRPAQGGHVRICEQDGSQHFPRTDPAVIMLVHDGADRCLLGRQSPWPGKRFSTLAGFVEPGESAEQAVAREVDEEVGLAVTDIEYRASQPWPFPSSLMFGYRARATAYEVDLRDGEIAEARWFRRDELRAAADAGDILLSHPVSIAHRLINDWLAGR